MLLCAVLGIFLLHYYHETVTLAKLAGYKGQGLMLYYARQASLNLSIRSVDRLASHSQNIAEAIAYVFSFIFLHNVVFFSKQKHKKNLINLLPVLIYLPFIVLSTGRTPFIRLIVVWFVIGAIFFLQKNRWQPENTKKIMKVGLISLAVFFLLFIAAGSYKDSNLVRNAVSTVSTYTGLSIPSLNDYLLHPRPQNDHFGKETLQGVYYFLDRIGIDFPKHYSSYSIPEFTYFGSTMGNVYTVCRRPLQDYGFVGMYISLFLFGAIYAFLFQWTKNRRSFRVICYAYIFYPVTMMSIEDQFFSSLVSLGLLWMLLYMAVIYFIFVKKTKLGIKRINP
jgi:oligosaccharide repeat unit polymerase